jgi:hypothetical protein
MTSTSSGDHLPTELVLQPQGEIGELVPTLG